MNEPWKCPQCGRIYAYWVAECHPCNAAAREREAEKGRPIDPRVRSPKEGRD